MASERYVRTREDLALVRELMRTTHEKARRALKEVLQHDSPLERLKFERLGCDPLDPEDRQNLAEQIDQQATYEAGADALEYLWEKHPGCEWVFAPGAQGAGHDITSTDGLVAAEVFAAVSPKNNNKLERDIDKISRFDGPNRYVMFRSPGHDRGERTVNGVVVVSLGTRANREQPPGVRSEQRLDPNQITGDHVRALREVLGLDELDFAALFGTPAHRVEGWERSSAPALNAAERTIIWGLMWAIEDRGLDLMRAEVNAFVARQRPRGDLAMWFISNIAEGDQARLWDLKPRIAREFSLSEDDICAFNLLGWVVDGGWDGWRSFEARVPISVTKRA